MGEKKRINSFGPALDREKKINASFLVWLFLALFLAATFRKIWRDGGGVGWEEGRKEMKIRKVG